MKNRIFLMLISTLFYSYVDSNNSAYSQQTQEIPDSTAGLHGDGPYVYWRDSTSVIVFYNCAGEIYKSEFRDPDTISFDGFCSDSNITYSLPTSPSTNEPFALEGVSRIFAISDIHGEYDIFHDILVNSGVIDTNSSWNWGDGHLVVAGDVFDRGAKVTECLWFIYRLEREARLSGGRVHFLLGNHELMVMRGDLRYVHQDYINGVSRKMRISYDDLHGPDMELGRWLRTKNTIIKLNNILFVHAGISPEIVNRDFSIQQINEQIRNNIDAPSTELAFNDQVQLLFKNHGPLWYRGYFENEDGRGPNQNQIDEILDTFHADALVIGHTGVDHVKAMYDNRVFAIDIPYESLFSFQALLYQDSAFYRVYGSGELEELH